MTVIPIAGVELATLPVHADERGSLSELFRQSAREENFVQSTHSRSLKGVLRGLHYHRKQSDLWYVVAGRLQVALADLRDRSRGHPTTTLVLQGDTPQTLFIPPGVAHGFLALSDVELIYHFTHEYDPSDEYGIAWNDPSLAVSWELSEPTLSERDRSNPELVWDQIPTFS